MRNVVSIKGIRSRRLDEGCPAIRSLRYIATKHAHVTIAATFEPADAANAGTARIHLGHGRGAGGFRKLCGLF
jgi:hypothetical protein